MESKALRLYSMIMIILIVIINVIGIYQADIMFFGFYGLVIIWNILVSNKMKLGKMLLFTFIFVLVYMIVKHSINFIFNYDTVSSENEFVTTPIKVLAGLITLVVSELLTIIIGLIGKAVKNKH